MLRCNVPVLQKNPPMIYKLNLPTNWCLLPSKMHSDSSLPGTALSSLSLLRWTALPGLSPWLDFGAPVILITKKPYWSIICGQIAEENILDVVGFDVVLHFFGQFLWLLLILPCERIVLQFQLIQVTFQTINSDTGVFFDLLFLFFDSLVVFDKSITCRTPLCLLLGNKFIIVKLSFEESKADLLVNFNKMVSHAS